MSIAIGWRRGTLALAVGIALALLAACGGDKEEALGGAKERIRAEDQARAEAIVLKQADLPGEWEIEPEEEDEEEGADPFEELGIDLSDLTVTGKAESPSFVRSGLTRAASFAAVLETEEQARQAYERVASRDLAETLREFVEGLGDEEAQITNVTVNPLPFPAFGDRSSLYQVAFEIEAEGQSINTYVDLAYVQRERAFGLLFFFDVITPFPDSEREEVARLLAERMEP